MTYNALALRPGGSGVQMYCRELLRALAGRIDAELAAVVQADAVGELPDGVRPLVRRPSDGARRALEGMRPHGPSDLVHGLDVDLPVRAGAPRVATVHDLSVFDGPWAGGRLRVAGERLLVRRAMRAADAVLAVSVFTAERIEALFGRTAIVTHEAPAPDMRPASPAAIAAARVRYRLPPTFVLQVGNIEPRKDVATLAAAGRTAGVPVVLAGARVAGSVPGNVVALGYVPRDDLPALYGAATVVAYLTTYEGFGLPPLEAMACGAPVLASRVASLPEVLGDAAELVPVGDVDAVAQTLRELVHDEARRSSLAQAGRKRAGRFTWTATATATADVYRSLGVRV